MAYSKSPASMGLVALALGALALGFSPILVRLADVGPVAIAFWRLVLALPVLFLWHLLVRRGESRKRTNAAWAGPWLLVLSGLLFAGDLSVWHVALRRTSVANSIFLLSAATPFFAALGGRIWLGQRTGRAFVGGMAISVIGAALLVSGRSGFGAGEWLGDLLSIVAAGFFASYLVAVARCRAAYPAATIALVSTLSAAVALALVSLALGEVFWPRSTAGWADLAALGLVSQAAGQTLIAFGLAYVTAGLSSLILLLEPVIAVLLAWPTLGEVPTPLQLAGCATILGGIWMARREGAVAAALP